MPNITSANATYMIAFPPIFAAPVKLQGFGTDSAFETDSSESVEVMKGVDGILSAGFVPFLTEQTVTLQADSASATLFETVLEQQKALLNVFFANAVIIIPSIGRKYVCTNGVLKGITQIPSARKVLGSRPFRLTWGNISPTVLVV